MKNPLVQRPSADPWVNLAGGRYYYCYSRQGAEQGGVYIVKARALRELGTAAATRVWSPPEGTEYSRDIWAPELHYVDGAWRVYVACDAGKNESHRMYVLDGGSDPDDPLCAAYTFAGKIADAADRWAIDATVMRHGGHDYFVWSGWNGDTDTGQRIYIARMEGAHALVGTGVEIAAPTEPWEQHELALCEGPQALCHGDKTFIIYSASASWTHAYALGMLELVGDDPLNPDHWVKAPQPVFASSEANRSYGVGHCSFTRSLDDREDIIVYHGMTHGESWAYRDIRAQVFTWDEEGRPNFGEPAAVWTPQNARPEHPRPQLQREDWVNLNGTWDFGFGEQREYDRSINVPFAHESPLSGIGETGFHGAMWYRRRLEMARPEPGKRALLHFGAVDYRARVYIDGTLQGEHEGGSAPFCIDVTDALHEGAVLEVYVQDPPQDERIPRGKQFWKEKSEGIWYTRTSGIWQTVWMETVSQTHIENLRMTPDVDAGMVEIEFDVTGDADGMTARVEIAFQGEAVVCDTIALREVSGRVCVTRAYRVTGERIFDTNLHGAGRLWSPEKPNLFDVALKIENDGAVLDRAVSYFGLRKIHTRDGVVYLNNRPYTQRLVLDQGYWREGLLTAASDDDYVLDIAMAKDMGFNGCRKHQKAEDPRFLYWADRLGYLVWGECPAVPLFHGDAVGRLMREWIEIVARDYNHPCIVAWVPLNESWGVPMIGSSRREQSYSLALYHMLHALDDTRLVVTNDGWEQTRTDICAVHNYNHGEAADVGTYERFMGTLGDRERMLTEQPAGRAIYAQGYGYEGEPILLTEFGGIGFAQGEAGWGYTSAADAKGYLSELRRVFRAVHASPVLGGFCYTQLTDVEQEINGLMTYDRMPKADVDAIRGIIAPGR